MNDHPKIEQHAKEIVGTLAVGCRTRRLPLGNAAANPGVFGDCGSSGGAYRRSGSSRAATSR